MKKIFAMILWALVVFLGLSFLVNGGGVNVVNPGSFTLYFFGGGTNFPTSQLSNDAKFASSNDVNAIVGSTNAATLTVLGNASNTLYTTANNASGTVWTAMSNASNTLYTVGNNASNVLATANSGTSNAMVNASNTLYTTFNNASNTLYTVANNASNTVVSHVGAIYFTTLTNRLRMISGNSTQDYYGTTYTP